MSSMTAATLTRSTMSVENSNEHNPDSMDRPPSPTLFEASGPEKKITTHIVHNGKRENTMSVGEIFDTQKYDTLRGVTFSASPDFLNKELDGFGRLTLVVGIPERQHQAAAGAAVQALADRARQLLADRPTTDFLNLKGELQ